MLRFLDGFKHYASADILKKWTSADGITIYPEGGPTGGGYMQMTGIIKTLRKTLDNQLTWVMGFRLFWSGTAFGTATFWYGGEKQVYIGVGSDGNITIYGGTYANSALASTTSAPITKEVWRYIEVRVDFDSASGRIEVKVDGDSVLVYEGPVGHISPSVGANVVGLDAQALTGTIGDAYTDVYICDGTGSVNNDFIGDVEVQTLYPDGPGYSADWTPLSGANWTNVDEQVVDGDASYVYANTSGKTDLYEYSDILESSGVVHGVQHNLWVRKVTSGSVKVAPVTRVGGSNHVGSAQTVSASYVDLLSIEETNPDTASPWLISEVNAAEFGQKVVTA